MATMLRWMTCLILAISLSSCAPRASEGDFYSDNPASKLYAIHRAGSARDPKAVKPLVDLLNDDDPAVRMEAINALERITGQRMGYNPYGSVVQRRPAIERWAAEANSGKWH